MADTILRSIHVVGLFCVMLLMQKTTAIQFTVGGAKGWTVPDSSSANSYNEWAERTRFQVGDSILFVYKPDQDSVLQVSKEKYDSCTTTEYINKFSDGHTVVTFHQSGPHYFISGNTENCNKNEKLIIVVLADRSNSSANSNQTTPASPPTPSGSADIVPSPAPAGEESPPAGGTVETIPTPSPSTESKPSTASSTIVSFIGCVGEKGHDASPLPKKIIEVLAVDVVSHLRSALPFICHLLPSSPLLKKPRGTTMLRALKATITIPRISSLTSVCRSASTLVIGEHEGGAIKAPSVSAVEAAKSLSDDNCISLLLAGSGTSLREAASRAASHHPAISQVLVADSDTFAHPLAEPWARLVHLVQQQGGYSHIIAASNSFGKNILPRAAALLDVSPITDVVDISGSGQYVRPIYAGNALCSVRYVGTNPCMLTIRATSFPVHAVLADSKSTDVPVTQVDLSTFGEDSIGKSRYVSQTSQDTERPDLGNARIVVTGGRALKNAENFKMIDKLAEKLGAAVGATRAAVDAGFVPNDLQVGQTGKIVAPELYMAFGVSGAIQHLAGMRDSRVIVAVNKDADAPIFQVADYGLVGDLFEVIPQLLEKLPGNKVD